MATLGSTEEGRETTRLQGLLGGCCSAEPFRPHSLALILSHCARRVPPNPCYWRPNLGVLCL